MRWKIEFVLAGIFVGLTVLTAFWPTWIESILGWSPDGGNGAGERWVALVFGVAALVVALLARRDRRSARVLISSRTPTPRVAGTLG